MAVRAPESFRSVALVRTLDALERRKKLRAEVGKWEDERSSLASYIPRVHRTDAGLPAVPPRHLRRVVEVLEDDSLGHTVIVAPPGSAKTNTAIAAVAWWLGRNPNDHIGFFSNTMGQAQRRSVAVRDLIQTNGDYQAIFPDVLPDTRKGWGESEWFLRRPDLADKDASLTAAGVGTAVLGSRLDRVVLDDIADPKNMATALQREKVLAWVKDVVMTRLTPKGRVVMICTRWNVADPVKWAREQGWTVIVIPAIDEAGESYWPERWPLNKLACPGDEHGKADPAWEPSEEHPEPPCWIERNEDGEITAQGNCARYVYGERQFNLMFLAIVVDDAMAIWKRVYWQRYKTFPSQILSGALFVDMAHGLKTENDYTVVGAWAQAGANFYVKDCIRDKYEFPELKVLLRGLVKMELTDENWREMLEPQARGVRAILARNGRINRGDPPPYPNWPIIIESTPGSTPLIQTLQREVPGVLAWPIEGQDKLARSHATVTYAETKNIWIPENAPWVPMWIEEHAAFPNGEHDDQVDVTTMALLRFRRGGRLITW